MYTENYKTLMIEIRHTLMEIYSMFLVRKNQHCENNYTCKGNLQIQCNPYQLPMAFFTEREQKILQFI